MWTDIERLAIEAQQPLADEWLEWLQRDMITQHVSSYVDAYYRFLYLLVQYARPSLALEIGTYCGVASAHMSAAADYGGHVVGINLKNHSIPATVLPDRYGNYTFIIGDSTAPETVEQVRALVAEHGPLGLVFQDSSHHYHHSMREWDSYRPMMTAGGWWVCDDITPAFHNLNVDPPDKGMVEYFNERPAQARRLFPGLHAGSVIGVLWL